VAKAGEHRVFGKASQNHVLILASGEKIRHMTIRPWMGALATCCIGVAVIGYLGATSYLVVRDDLIGATMARQARMQYDYEDRISALRAQLDRITSRQLLDQQVVEQKVDKLMQQQNALFSRHGKLGSLLDRAQENGLMGKDDPSQLTPDTLPAATGSKPTSDTDRHADITAPDGSTLLALAPLRENLADRADRVFSKVTRSLKTIERAQMTKIAALTSGAADTADAISDILRKTGVDVASVEDDETPAGIDKTSTSGIGGPYVEPQLFGSAFDNSLGQLDAALDRLEKVRATARDLPFGNPEPGHAVTSQFGNRMDPFLGRIALHAGIDFQAAIGDNIRATGAGKVIFAGPSTGYGNMVEIDHGYGITTRYGHMSKILVTLGEKVAAGDVIALAGAEGRATGPHVHYEVRRNGEAINPIHFLNAGLKLNTYIE
jgi:murein DD-endopeptidase MepM/ murein hydrolase activator NlpD